MTKILFFAGSARDESCNKKLVKAACNIALSKGVEATFIDLKAYPMAMFDEDFEAEHGMDENAKKFKQMLIDHDGFFVASPEYNGSYSALLKNAIDWATRPEDGEVPLLAFKGKVAAIGGAAPGAMGGIRMLSPLRTLLSGIGVHVVPSQIALSGAFSAFGDDGALLNDRMRKMLEKTVDQLIATTKALSAA